MAFNITSKAFEYGASIPVKYGCTGDDLSPPLRWDEIPKDTTSLALIMENPDAPGGTFTHWIRWIERNYSDTEKSGQRSHSGKNDFGKTGNCGPCPPKGEEHRYFFRLFALKKKLPPESANKADDFCNVINKSILEKAEYMGKLRK